MKEQKENPALVSICANADGGHARTEQQDSYGYVNIPRSKKSLLQHQHRGLLFVVADGVASSAAGEQASSIAVQTIIESYYTLPATNIESCLKNAILRANQRLYSRRDTTTVVCAVIHGTNLYVAHVGDSRAYLLHAGVFSRLTADHSQVQKLIDEEQLSEEEAKKRASRHLITRALGSQPQVEPDINCFNIEAYDYLLLASDGVHGQLSDETIESLLVANTNNLKAACAALVEQANLSGGADNISLIVARVEPTFSVADDNQERYLPPLSISDINSFSYVSLASTTPQPFRPHDINNLSDTNLTPVHEGVSPRTSSNVSWWQHRLPSWVLLIVTLVFVLILIVQAAFQSEYLRVRRDLHRAQQNIEALISDVEQQNYDELDSELLQRLRKIKQELNTSSFEDTSNQIFIFPESTAPSSTESTK